MARKVDVTVFVIINGIKPYICILKYVTAYSTVVSEIPLPAIRPISSLANTTPITIIIADKKILNISDCLNVWLAFS